jgi:hypothetical protein
LKTGQARAAAPRPTTGFGGRAIQGQAIPRGNWSGPQVRGQMNFVSGRGNGFTRATLATQMRGETGRNQYYWHQDQGFDYCHYHDAYGANWFGWYLGTGFFWTQYYGGGWWIYDDGQGRWCYWSQGNWWWQDPGDPQMIYLYDNGDYIPAN